MSNFRSDAARERRLLAEQRAAEKIAAEEQQAAEQRALQQAKQEAKHLVNATAATVFAVAAGVATLYLGNGSVPKIQSKY